MCRGDPRDRWREITRRPDAAGFRHYRRDDGRHLGNGQSSVPPEDWPARARRYAEALTPALRAELARSLGLPVEALKALPLVGWWEKVTSWTFPECDARGNVVGVLRRPRVGRKVRMRGSHCGLTLPSGWRGRPGPLFLVEGPTDVLALTLCGLPCVGRPSNTGGVEQLAALLGDWPANREIIVIGENDGPRPDTGLWPGRDGAEQTARALAGKLRRGVRVAFPPPEY
jgi:hypothetical protein